MGSDLLIFDVGDVVEAYGHVARELAVLLLVLADGDVLRLIEQYVRGHERGIGE